MLRRLLVAIVCLSVLLCAATVVLWGRSYFVPDQFLWCYPGGLTNLQVSRGRCEFTRRAQEGGTVYPSNRTFEWHEGRLGWFPPEIQPRGDDFWFEARSDRHFSVVFVTVPFWAVALATVLPPAAWFLTGRHRRRRRAARRARAGRCVACGYDLTGNTSGACPECGRPRSPTNAATYSSSATPARTSTATRA